MADTQTRVHDSEVVQAETRAVAEAVWERWQGETLAWLQALGAGTWQSIAFDATAVEAPEVTGRYVYLMGGGGIATGERDGTLPVHRVRLRCEFEAEESLDSAADSVARALEVAVDSAVSSVQRLTGAVETVVASGGLSVLVSPLADDLGRAVLVELPIAVGSPLAPIPEPTPAPPGLEPPPVTSTGQEVVPPKDEPPAPPKAPAKKAAGAAKKQAGAAGKAGEPDEAAGDGDGAGVNDGDD